MRNQPEISAKSAETGAQLAETSAQSAEARKIANREFAFSHFSSRNLVAISHLSKVRMRKSHEIGRKIAENRQKSCRDFTISHFSKVRNRDKCDT